MPVVRAGALARAVEVVRRAALRGFALMSDDLPEPDTPVTATNMPSGNATSMFLRLFSRAPLDEQPLAVAGAPLRGHRDLARGRRGTRR